MNNHEAERIAAAMNQLRPDWPTKQLRTLLADARMVDRPRRDVVVALSWVACESGTATPYRVLESGPWWRATGVEGGATARRPWNPHEFCECGQPMNGHRSTDHEPITRPQLAARVAAQGIDVTRAVAGLRDVKATVAPPEHPEPATPEPDPHVEELRGQIKEATA